MARVEAADAARAAQEQQRKAAQDALCADYRRPAPGTSPQRRVAQGLFCDVGSTASDEASYERTPR